MSTAPDRRLTTAALLLNALAARYTTAHNILRASQRDGYPTTASGADTGPRTGGQTILVDGDHIPVTSVEAAVIARLEHHQRINDAERADLEATANGILIMVNNLNREITRILGNHIDTPRCSGGAARDGALEWGRPDCTNVPSRGPLCERCAKAEWRWRKNHDLPARTDGVFSAPAVA